MGEVNVDVEHVTRVEGHGNITVNAQDGTVEDVKWEVTEAPRFFESLVKDKSYDKTQRITSRICGICSIGHSLTSLKATEKAMDIEISEQDEMLRKLALHGENVQSHILHVGYLALPDLAGKESVIPMASSHTDEVKTVIRVHKLANELSRLTCGRTTHPRRLVPGGFTKIPSPPELEEMRGELEDSVSDLKEIASVVKSLSSELPDFERETEFISLTNDSNEYPLYDGEILSSDTGSIPVENYEDFANEYVVEQSTAKYAKNNREAYMVGALARVNNNYEDLSPLAKEVAEDLGLEPMCYNPYMNNVAQLVEVVHSIEDSMNLIDKLLDSGLEEQEPNYEPDVDVKSGRGIAAVEVPRGILFHDYTYDEDGKCQAANCIIPTNQNHGNIQKDMESLVPNIIDEKDEDEIELTLEMLVRAYDPCISCSTHYLDVDFVE